MSSQLRTHEKTLSNSSSAPLKNSIFQPRPFADSANLDEVSSDPNETLDLHTQTDKATRFGHNFFTLETIADLPATDVPGAKAAQGESASVNDLTLSLQRTEEQGLPIQRWEWFDNLFSDNNDDNDLAEPVFGRAGAAGRENFVRTQENRAYEAGRNVPQVDFDGTLHRTVPTDRWQGYANHLFSDKGGGRYNDPGMRLIYASPTADESVAEARAYPKYKIDPVTKQPIIDPATGEKIPIDPLADQTRVEFEYKAAVDAATGKGGVADISNNMSDLGLMKSALTAKKGGEGPDFWHRLAGEDPYLHSRAVGRGASDAGASAMQVPSATSGNQIDIIPANTDPSQITYQQHTHYDGSGNPSATHSLPGEAKVMPLGDAPSPHNQAPETSPGRTQRGGSGRYGALAAGGMAAVRNLMDGDLSAKDVGDIGLNAGIGGLSGVANDALHPRLGGGFRGGLKAGAIVDAVTSGLFSTWDNAGAYERGETTAGQATANVIVDTGVGVGAGLAGAAAGAAIGSVIPVAGTAVGAGLGFLAGMAGSWAANELASASGFTDWAKEGLGGVLNNYNESLSGAWDGIASTTSAISEGVGDAWDTVSDGAGDAWNAVSNWWNDD